MIILITLLISTIACTSPSDETFTIGAVLTLTGDFSVYGEEHLNSINLFLENKEDMTLVLEDSQTESKAALSALRKIQLKNPDILLTYGSSISLALQPIINEKKLPTITIAANPDTAKGQMIQNLPTSDDYVIGVVKELNAERVGIIYRNDDWGIAVKEAFKEKFEGTTFEEASDPKEQDFKTIITKIKSKNPDALFVVHTDQKLGILIKQIRVLMGNILISSSYEISYPDVKETAGEHFNNIIYSDLNTDLENQAFRKFRNAYLEKYGSEPSVDAIVGYNAMIMIDKCKKENELLKCLTTNEFDGITGKIKVKNNRVDYSSSMVLKKV